MVDERKTHFVDITLPLQTQRHFILLFYFAVHYRGAFPIEQVQLEYMCIYYVIFRFIIH